VGRPRSARSVPHCSTRQRRNAAVLRALSRATATGVCEVRARTTRSRREARACERAVLPRDAAAPLPLPRAVRRKHAVSAVCASRRRRRVGSPRARCGCSETRSMQGMLRTLQQLRFLERVWPAAVPTSGGVVRCTRRAARAKVSGDGEAGVRYRRVARTHALVQRRPVWRHRRQGSCAARSALPAAPPERRKARAAVVIKNVSFCCGCAARA
jgi:hypothetical protein